MHIGVVRGIAAALGLCLAPACVGTNPWWDRPEDAETSGGTSDGGAGESEDESETSGPGRGVVDDGEVGDETTTDTGGDDTTTDTGGESEGPTPPVCEDHQAVCAGECKNIDKDKHACGIDCVDCTTLFGDDARCKQGACEPHD